jgi:hypothetical protein
MSRTDRDIFKAMEGMTNGVGVGRLSDTPDTH